MTFVQELSNREWRPAVDRIIAAVTARPERLPELVATLRHPRDGVVMRGAMALADLGRAQPALLVPYHRELVDLLQSDPIDATNRCLFRYFAELPLADVDPAVEGELLDLAFRRGSDPQSSVTIRIWGLQIVANYCARYPELRDELRGVIEEQMPTAPAGFRSRGRKILAAIAE